MKRFALLIIGVLLTACTSVSSGNGGMMQGETGMMHDRTDTQVSLLAGEKEVSSLPEVRSTETMDIQDGQTVTFTPTLVRKKISGKDVAMYGYNGQIPGPLLRVKQGSTFTVQVKNDIDVPTSVHWHGLRLNNANDGAVGITQEEIQPGDSFTYTIKVPDEGIYWYHTHVREDMQQPLGLYGGILVLPSATTAYAPVDDEQVVFINDLLLDGNKDLVPYGAEQPDHTLMGRFGNTFLVNGKENAMFDVGLGSVHRYYIVNASNTRTYRVIAPPQGRMKLAGGDSGRYEQEQFVESVNLSPSERLIVDVEFTDDEVNSGSAASKAVPLVVAGPPQDPTNVLLINVNGGVYKANKAFDVLRKNNDVVRSMDPFRSVFDKAPDHTLILDMSMMGGAMGGRGMMAQEPSPDGIEWEDTTGMDMPGMNSMMKWKLIDQETRAANDQLVYTAKVGDKVKIRIINKKDSPHPMQHPIHFHGQRFLVLSDNGVKNTDLVWKDTVLVPAGHTVDILLDASNPGDWMFHCHIAEHLGSGMMGLLRVQ